MKSMMRSPAVLATAAVWIAVAHAGSYPDTLSLFKHAGQSGSYFDKSYAYAVFPNIGKAGFVVGGAHGKGRVYVHGESIGTTTMNQISVGAQAGGQDYSEIVFFQDKRALDEFTAGGFEFAADAGAVAITAAASASAGTNGATAGASGGDKNAATAGGFYKGMAVFTIVKGGLMYDAVIAGQKFSFTPHRPS